MLVLLTSSLSATTCSWTVGVNTAQWYPPANPGDAPALTDDEQAAGSYYVWDEATINPDPATVLGSDHT